MQLAVELQQKQNVILALSQNDSENKLFSTCQ